MKNFYDAVIIGGGPAGLAAAIYLSRAQYQVLVVEKETIGGQITITSEVVNYPGILRTDGRKLTETMKVQAQNFGADFLLAEVWEVSLEGERKYVVTDKGKIETLGIVLATGASPRKAGFDGEEAFRGRGVAYCATCDGEFFTGKQVLVVGGGFAAVEEALFLTRYANSITMIVRGEDFSCAGPSVEELLAHPDIEVCFQTEIVEVGGSQMLEYALLRDRQTKETRRIQAAQGDSLGVFVFVGYEPATKWIQDQISLSAGGYILTGKSQETSLPGVYAAGDVCEKNLRQVVTAVSDGAVAATSLEKYLFAMYQKLGMKREKRKVRPVKETEQEPEKSAQTGFLTAEMKETLKPVFARFEKELVVKVYTDGSGLSEEVEGFVSELAPLCEKVHFQTAEKETKEIIYPALVLCDERGKELGVEFHGVPGGHEFNSFVIALYNAAGPGQPLSETLLEKIRGIREEIHMKIAVSLSCTMCPEVVMAAQRIALENPHIQAEMFDLAHYPELKEKYQIMSVPCLILNDSRVSFGKKGVAQILELIGA